MRKMGIFGAGMLAAASLGVSGMASVGSEYNFRRRHPAFIPAWMNRHTGEPHEHKREIARRAKQAARRAA